MSNTSIVYEKEIEGYNYNNRIISSLILDKYDLITVFYYQKKENTTDIYLVLNYYNYSLENLGNSQIDKISYWEEGRRLFFKSVILYENYIAILYFIDLNKYKLRIIVLSKKNNNSYNLELGLLFNDNTQKINFDITLNDFIRINNKTLAFISTSEENKLLIILYDFYDSYKYMKVRYYKFDFSQKITSFVNDLSAYLYNDYIAFTSTVFSNNKSYPIFMIFGYANGTDLEIDISKYFIDNEVYSNINNLVRDLLDTIVIDNNIFGYIQENKIKLVSIPEEIIFYYNINDTIIVNNGIIDENYILKQNTYKIKNDSYYFLKFQYIIKEPDYDTFYYNNSYNTTYLNHSSSFSDSDIKNYFEPKIFYSKINTLKFKLRNSN